MSGPIPYPPIWSADGRGLIKTEAVPDLDVLYAYGSVLSARASGIGSVGADVAPRLGSAQPSTNRPGRGLDMGLRTDDSFARSGLRCHHAAAAARSCDAGRRSRNRGLLALIWFTDVGRGDAPARLQSGS